MHNHTQGRISFSSGCSELRFSLLLLCFNTVCELDQIDSQRFSTSAQKLYSNNFVGSLTWLSTAIVNLCFLSGKKNRAIPQPLRQIVWEVCLIVFPFLTFLTSITFSTEVVRNYLGAVLKFFEIRDNYDCVTNKFRRLTNVTKISSQTKMRAQLLCCIIKNLKLKGECFF